VKGVPPIQNSGYVRTPDDLIQALLPDEPATTTPQPSRPKPTGKRVFGTLAGKEKALTHLARQVAEREQAQLTDRVVLTDGSLSLQRQVALHLPHFTLILDIMHVLHYLWDAANVLLGETHPQRTAWMRTALRCLLDNDLDTLVAQLETQAARPKLAQHKRKTLSKVVNYLCRNRPYMDYRSYLARGWPIGTGVIEGACRHLVRDRFEQTGMCWSIVGAEAMLQVRAVYLNGDWAAFQRFRRRHVHKQRYGSLHPDSLPETSVLQAVA
jgi:hypothetical protein